MRLNNPVFNRALTERIGALKAAKAAAPAPAAEAPAPRAEAQKLMRKGRGASLMFGVDAKAEPAKKRLLG